MAPIERLSLKVMVFRPVHRVESARLGALEFKQSDKKNLELSLPLANNDFVKIYCDP